MVLLIMKIREMLRYILVNARPVCTTLQAPTIPPHLSQSMTGQMFCYHDDHCQNYHPSLPNQQIHVLLVLVAGTSGYRSIPNLENISMVTFSLSNPWLSSIFHEKPFLFQTRLPSSPKFPNQGIETDALRYENGRDLCGANIRVEWAKGAPRGSGGGPPPRGGPVEECYRCHRTGHFARDCRSSGYGGGYRSSRGGGGRYRSPSPRRRRRSRSRSRDRRRSRSRSRERRRDKSRSTSRDRKRINHENASRSRSRSKSKSSSRSKSRSLSKSKSPEQQEVENGDE